MCAHVCAHMCEPWRGKRTTLLKLEIEVGIWSMYEDYPDLLAKSNHTNHLTEGVTKIPFTHTTGHKNKTFRGCPCL